MLSSFNQYSKILWFKSKVLLADIEAGSLLKTKRIGLKVRVTREYYEKEINATLSKLYDAFYNRAMRNKLQNKVLDKSFLPDSVPLIFVGGKSLILKLFKNRIG